MDLHFPRSILQKWQRQDYQPVKRVLLIIGLFLLTFMTTLVDDVTIKTAIVALVIGTGVILVILREPALGVIAIIPASLVSPVAISVSSGTSINGVILLIMLLTVIWIIDMVVRQKQIKLVPSRTVLPLLVLLFVATLSFAFGQLPWFLFANKAPITAQLGGLALFFFAVIAFLSTAHFLQDIKWLKWLTWTFLALGSFLFITQIVPGMRIIGLNLYNEGGVSSLFWLWTVALSLSQALFNNKLDIKFRIVLIVLSVMAVYVSYTIIDGWKSGWVPALVTLSVLVAFRSKRVAMAILIVGLITLPFVASSLLATEEYSYSTRVEAWMLIIDMVKVNPILGLGPANYYWYTPLFPIRGYAVQFNSHNQFIDLYAQIGIAGLAVFMWFVAEIGALGLRLRNKVEEGFPKAYVYGAIAGLVGTLAACMLGDWFLPFVYNVGYNGFQGAVLGWLFLGGLVVIEQISQKENT